MFKQALVAALFAVNLTNGFYTTSIIDDTTEGGMPGALQLFLNVNSMNTLIKDASKAVPYYALKGKSFDLDLDINLKGLDLKINQVNITDVTIGDAGMAFVGDSNTVRTTFTNANITLAVDAQGTSIFPIKLDITEVFLQNVTLQLDLATSSEDQLTWQLQEAMILEIETFTITAKEKFWQKKLDKYSDEIEKLVAYGLNFATGIVAGLVDALNTKMQNADPDTFVFNISPLGVDVPMPFNLTMSKAPELSNEKGEIILHIDGDFEFSDLSTYIPADTVYADYASQKQKEQLWIHQSMINSALYMIQKTLSGEGFQSQIFVLIAELHSYYGVNADCEGVLTFPKEANSQPISMNTVQGIVIGDETNGGLNLNLNIMCSNETTTEKELAVVLNTGVHVVANITWDNFDFWAALSDPQFFTTTCVSKQDDLVLDYHNWNSELTAVLTDITNDFNLRWSTPHDLKKKSSLIAMVAGLLRATLLSPYVTDEFLFIGFKMILDK